MSLLSEFDVLDCSVTARELNKNLDFDKTKPNNNNKTPQTSEIHRVRMSVVEWDVGLRHHRHPLLGDLRSSGFRYLKSPDDERRKTLLVFNTGRIPTNFKAKSQGGRARKPF